VPLFYVPCVYPGFSWHNLSQVKFPSDHYLWLTGEAAKMLRKEKPLSLVIPERNQ
jgi:hypothetical protein